MEYSIEDQIKNTLEKVRPFLVRDGGDVSFSRFENGICYVKMSGACVGCSYIDETIGSGIEIILKEEVPGVTAVKVEVDESELNPENLF